MGLGTVGHCQLKLNQYFPQFVCIYMCVYMCSVMCVYPMQVLFETGTTYYVLDQICQGSWLGKTHKASIIFTPALAE